jgi:hypothetical protein
MGSVIGASAYSTASPRVAFVRRTEPHKLRTTFFSYADITSLFLPHRRLRVCLVPMHSL